MAKVRSRSGAGTNLRHAELVATGQYTRMITAIEAKLVFNSTPTRLPLTPFYLDSTSSTKVAMLKRPRICNRRIWRTPSRRLPCAPRG